MKFIHRNTLLAAGLLLGFNTFSAQASLTAGTAGGQSVVYSSISNITWTGNANLLGTMEASNSSLVNTIISTIVSISDIPNEFDTPANSGIHTLTTADFGENGLVNWYGAQAFTSYLNSINYAGSNQWALPTAGSNPQRGFNQTSTQFGQLFYNELGGTAGSPIPNTSNFTNEQAYSYWLATELPPAFSPNFAWSFDTDNLGSGGYQDFYGKGGPFPLYVWAVSPGNLTAVPVPSAVWLFGSGLVGLLGFKRRCNNG